MTEFSGRTTYHISDNIDWDKTKGAGKECLRLQLVFDVQLSNCPYELKEEIHKLWRDYHLGNDKFFYHWTDEEDNGDCIIYPLIAEYLRARDVRDCWIHYWW